MRIELQYESDLSRVRTERGNFIFELCIVKKLAKCINRLLRKFM